MIEMQNSGLQNSDITDIVETLQKNRKINKVILFGSRSKGTFNEGSDIDIALSGKELNTNDIIDLTIDLEELGLPYKFDIVIWERIQEPALSDHISRVGVTLFERK